MGLNDREKEPVRVRGVQEERREGKESGDVTTHLVGIPRCDWQDQLLCSPHDVVGLEELGLRPRCHSIG